MSNTDVSAAKADVVYELAYVLRVGESDQGLRAVLQKVGATVVKEQPASQIQLAYPIKKQGSGLFGYMHLTVPSGDAISEISDALQFTDSVLRFIIVRIPESRKQKVAAQRKEQAETAEGEKKPTSAIPAVDRLDSLSNEKLSETLEEILK